MLAAYRSDLAVRRLDDLMQERPSRLLKVLKAEALSEWRVFHQDVGSAEELVAAAEEARTVLGDTRHALSQAYFARHAAVVAHDLAGPRPDRRADHRTKARAHLLQLERRWPTWDVTVMAAPVDPALDSPTDRGTGLAARWRAVRPEFPLSRFMLADSLFRPAPPDGDRELAALADADRTDRGLGLFRVFLAADGWYPGRRPIDLWEEWAGPPERWSFDRLYMCGVGALLACGPDGWAKAREVAAWLEKNVARKDLMSEANFDETLRYLKPELPEPEYRLTVRPGVVGAGKLLFLGCSRLGGGRVREAKATFEEAAHMRVCTTGPDVLASTLLARLRADPAWPRGVPRVKE